MKHSINTAVVVGSAMERLNKEYREILDLTTPISLLHLFNSEFLDFEDYCKDYSPHPAISNLKQLTLQFAEQYAILLPHAESYITCVMFLFPHATLDKIIPLSKNYAIDFYLNDTMGRETQPTEKERQHLYEIRARLFAYGSRLDPERTQSLPERANIEVLAQISYAAPAEWFDRFLESYLLHIDVAHKTRDATSGGAIQTVEEYIGVRREISGMPHTVTLIEYSTDTYLDWPELQRAGIADELEKINDAVSLIGALTNDLFSFEKEVIDHRSDSNLIPVIILNNFRMKLHEAIQVASAIIKNLLIDYTKSLHAIREKLDLSERLSGEQKHHVYVYLDGLKAVLQACWMWQKSTKRYKRKFSIWLETNSQDLVTR